MCGGSIGTSSPPDRATCTVRAASSHITAAFTAAFALAPIVNVPWARVSPAGVLSPALAGSCPGLLA
jgi:hypothetical protein